MLDLYDFFGSFSIGITPKDLHPESNEIDKYIMDTIKEEAANGDREAQEWLKRG